MESGWPEGGSKYSFNDYLSSSYYMHELYSGVPDRHDPPSPHGTCYPAGYPWKEGFPGCSPGSYWLLFPQKREAFCQLLQLMKNKHSKQDEPDMISVFIGTWNMGEAWGRGRGEREKWPQCRGLTTPIPSASRKCASSEKCDILVHIEGPGEDPGRGHSCHTP